MVRAECSSHARGLPTQQTMSLAVPNLLLASDRGNSACVTKMNAADSNCKKKTKTLCSPLVVFVTNLITSPVFKCTGKKELLNDNKCRLLRKWERKSSFVKINVWMRVLTVSCVCILQGIDVFRTRIIISVGAYKVYLKNVAGIIPKRHSLNLLKKAQHPPPPPPPQPHPSPLPPLPTLDRNKLSRQQHCWWSAPGTQICLCEDNCCCLRFRNLDCFPWHLEFVEHRFLMCVWLL